MTISLADLNAFHHFAVTKLSNGDALSITELAQQWDAARECDEAAADIRESLADIEAGRTTPLAEAFADIRRQLGLSQ